MTLLMAGVARGNVGAYGQDGAKVTPPQTRQAGGGGWRRVAVAVAAVAVAIAVAVAVWQSRWRRWWWWRWWRSGSIATV